MNPVLQDNPLFAGIESGELDTMLRCLDVQKQAYVRGTTVFLAGEPARRVGLVLEGAVQIERDDILGNRTILSVVGAGDLFGETFACAGVKTLPVSAVAAADCSILLLDYRRIVRSCSSACVFHARLVQNMLQILAGKNLMLNRKIEVLSARGIREKLMAFLMAEAAKNGGRQFEIALNRQELADFLAVDRSALSREMGAMQREGLIAFQKNHFSLLSQDAFARKIW